MAQDQAAEVPGRGARLRAEELAPDPAPEPRWRIACSCGWERSASSAWAATAIFRLHTRYLADPGAEHFIMIEEPRNRDVPRQADRPFT